MMLRKLCLSLLGLFVALNVTGIEMQTRCRLTHFANGEPEIFNLNPEKHLVAVEARAALPGDNPNGEMSENSWGVEFDNGLRVTLCRGNTDYGSEYNRQTLLVCVCQGDSLLQKGVLYDGLSSKPSEYHGIKLTFDDDKVMKVQAGCRDMMPVLSCALPETWTSPTDVKLVAHAKKWQPSYLWVEEADNLQIPIYPFDAEALCAVGEGLGGMWKLFDRENDSRYAIPGGEYTLACIPDPEKEGEYLLLIDSGVQKCPELWPKGAMKGRLIPTPFKMQYVLSWTAADGKPLEDEAYAELRDDNQLLTLVFPLHHATLRFSRCR